MNRLYAPIFSAGLALAVSACHSSHPGELVPYIIDYTIPAATAKLKTFGLVLGTQTTASSSTVPAGEIISESPIAGTTVGLGTPVDVVVSTGPAAAAAPAAVTAPSTAASDAPAVALMRSLAGPVAASAAPATSLTLGMDGSFYGVSSTGGANRNLGAFFRVTASGARTTLYSFGSRNDDAIRPDANLIQGSDGNFYGTSATGGASGEGTVFRITPAGVETVLVSFAGGAGGEPASPAGGLIEGADGNFYGTTRAGGTNGTGVVYRLTPAGVLSTLYSFGSNRNGGLSDAATEATR